MTVLTIAWRYLQGRRVASALTVLSIALGVSLVVATTLLTGGIRAGFIEGTTDYSLVVGSSAYDPERRLLFMNTNRLPFVLRLIPRDRLAAEFAQLPQSGAVRGELAPQTGTPYGMHRAPLLAPGGLPCNAPPWGTVAAVDLFAGDKRWDVPLGTWVPGMGTGTLNLGGPIVTAGGLVFTGKRNRCNTHPRLA